MPLRVDNPFSDQIVCELDHDTDATVEPHLERARAAFLTWRATPLTERIEFVRAGIEYFRAHREAIARDITVQMGKPITQSRGEVDGMIQRAEAMVAIAPATLAPDVLPALDGLHRRIEHVPHGVVLNLSAWNYPLLITVNVVVPALLAGNTVLLKHSARTPLCGVHFERAFGDGDRVKHLVLDHAATAALCADPRVAHVAFTGSVEGGRRIAEAVSPRFVDVGLELGGKDPAYIAADADPATAFDAVVDGACYNAGQSCCAVERVYVHRDHHDAFLARAVELCGEYRLGDPLDESTTMGPMASRAALDTLEEQVRDATARGARVLCGGQRIHERFFPATVVVDCPNDAEIMQEESFGPLIPVARVDSDEEALQRMNDSRFGLTASVWTRSRARAERFAAALETGTVYQNRCDYLDPEQPWTGVKDSGRGTTLSRYGLLALTRRKTLHFRG